MSVWNKLGEPCTSCLLSTVQLVGPQDLSKGGEREDDKAFAVPIGRCMQSPYTNHSRTVADIKS